MAMKSLALVVAAALLLSAPAIAQDVDPKKMKFVGTSTREGSPPWEVVLDFFKGDGFWNRTNPPGSERKSLRQSKLEGDRISFQAKALFRPAALVSFCQGTVSGAVLDARCDAHGNHPDESIVGRLEYIK